MASNKLSQFEVLLAGIEYNNQALAGGIVYFYSAGTTDAQHAYSDNTYDTPILYTVLDGQGKSKVYGYGAYKLVVRDSTDSTTIYTLDNIFVGNQQEVAITINTNYVLSDPSIDVILADATSGNITISLATYTSFTSTVTIKKTDATTNTVTIDAFGSELIDAAATYVLDESTTQVAIYPDAGLGKWISLSASYLSTTGGTISGDLSITGTSTTAGIVNTGTISSTSHISTSVGNITSAGTMSSTGAMSSSSTVTGTRLISTIATGTAPLGVTSTTAVTNLNADKVDGFDLDQDVRTTASPTFVRPTFSQATGSSPMAVSSTTVVTNLNADLLDGYNASQTPGTAQIPVTDSSGVLNLVNNVSMTNADQVILIQKSTAGNQWELYAYDDGWQLYNRTGSLVGLRVLNDGTFTANGNTVWTSSTDGSGSGLDADTLDTYHASQTPAANQVVVLDGSGQLDIPSNILMENNAAIVGKDTSNVAQFIIRLDNFDQIVVGDESLPLLLRSNGTIDHNGNIVWTSTNDGSGSGLDADTVDGIEGSAIITTSNIASQTVSAATTATNASGTGSIPLARSENSLRILRGNIDTDGTILEGAGFTVSRAGIDATITWTNAFSDVPTVVISPLNADANVARSAVNSVSTTQAVIRSYNSSNNASFAFTMIVMGPN